jgi:hypothetical protein
MSRVRWPALYSNYKLAQEWKERVEVLIHQKLKKVDFSRRGRNLVTSEIGKGLSDTG